jgi:WhiB family redox-sensing transcriptional regulator
VSARPGSPQASHARGLVAIGGQAWREQALCAQVDAELFFPDIGEGDKSRQARAVCWACPVREPCLAHALAHNEQFGIWGGHTAASRDRMRRHAS